MQHRGPDSYGYLFEEKARRPFLAEKADALGIPPGPLRGKLVAGEAVTLDDGRMITPEMVMGDFRPGTRLAALGDLGETDSLVDLLQGVDGLVIESTYLEEEAEHGQAVLPPDRAQAADFANQIERAQADPHPPQPPLPRQGRAGRSAGGLPQC